MGTSDAYVPSRMTEKALKVSMTKYYEPCRYISERLIAQLTYWLHNYLAPFWQGDNFTSYEKAVSLLDLTKSPGYPLYYRCQTKGEALADSGDEILRDVLAILNGEEILEINSIALKDELRPEEKVAEDKTRAFISGALKHHLAATQLFHQQNEKLQQTIGLHSITIGISVPGPQFVQTVVGLSDRADCYYADVSGNDARFPLPLARVIRNVRAAFLPEHYKSAVFWLYNLIYCGLAVCLGILYVLFHQKSGWKNTGHDNSLQVLLVLRICNLHFSPDLEFDEFIKLIVNGDDFAFRMINGNSKYGPLSVQMLEKFSRERLGVYIEFGNLEGLRPTQIVFLSHSLKVRYHPAYGDFLIAAGNKPKLLSSISWVRLSNEFTFEESVLMHWLGLRIMLWPWEIEFELLEDEIDKFLSTISLTENIRLILRARISQQHIAWIHLRLEGYFFTSPDPIEVFKNLGCLIKDVFTSDIDYLPYQSQKTQMTNGPKEIITIESVSGNATTTSADVAKGRNQKRAERRKRQRERRKQERTSSGQPVGTTRARQTAPGGLGGYPTRNQLTRFAASIVWPAQTGIPAVRYSDPSQTTPTALGRPWTQIEAPWGDADTTQILSLQIFRSVARAYTIDFPYNTQDYLYDVYGTNSSASSSSPPAPIAQLTLPPNTKQDYHGPFAVAQSGGGLFAPHGPTVYGGFPGSPSRAVRYFWMETGTVVSGAFTLLTAGVDQTIEIYLEKWSFTDSFEDDQIGSFSVDTGVNTPFATNIPSQGWYGVSALNNMDQVHNISISWSFGGQGAVLGQRCLPFLDSRIAELEQFHVTSGAGRYENTAAPNFRSGKVAVYQVPAQQDNFQFIRDFNKVAQASGAWSEEATDGSYGWLRPVDRALEMRMTSEFRIVNSQIYDSYWDMSLPTQYKTFSVRVPAQTTTGGNPKSGIWWAYFNVEYVTESPWPEKQLPSKDYAAYDRAISELGEVPGASTNKSHLKLLQGYMDKARRMFATPSSALRNGYKIARDTVDTIADIAN